MNKIVGFGPLISHEARVLILGSMPGAASLEKQEYYGHAQNHFWPLLFAVLQEPCPETYAERVARVVARGISVWDSIHICERPGSLDKDIRHEEPNDIPALLAGYPGIRCVAFNGTMAQKVYRAYFPMQAGISYLLLPSSSPVPRKTIRRMEDKLPFWMQLRQYIQSS